MKKFIKIVYPFLWGVEVKEERPINHALFWEVTKKLEPQLMEVLMRFLLVEMLLACFISALSSVYTGLTLLALCAVTLGTQLLASSVGRSLDLRLSWTGASAAALLMLTVKSQDPLSIALGLTLSSAMTAIAICYVIPRNHKWQKEERLRQIILRLETA
jgi:hypothetical protein